MIGLSLAQAVRQRRAGGATPPAEVPAVTAAPEITGTPQVGETLTASNAAWTNGPILWRARQWYQADDDAGTNAAAITDETGATYDVAVAGGKFVAVGEIATNAAGASEEAFSEWVGPVIAAPVFLSPSSVDAPEGSPYLHELTTDQASTFTIIGGADSAQGSVAGDELTLASQTYAGGGGDNDRVIEVRAAAIATGLTATQTITFNITQVTAPANTVPPSIAGDNIEGAILTATPGTWTGAGSITGQWYRDSSAITDETGLTYRLAEADIGAAVKYRETATNGGGSTSEDSNATDAVLSGIIARLAFRQSSGFVTDDPRWTYVLATDTSLTSRGGYQFQYITGMSFANTDVGYPKPLAGQAAATGASGRVSVVVPTGVDLNVRLCFGAPQGSATLGGQIQNGDGGTAIVTYPAIAQGAGQVAGADGALIALEDWVSLSPALEVTAAQNTAGALVFRKGPNGSTFPIRAVEITYPQFSQVTAGVGPFYVDAADGDDVTGDGSEANPWQHIPGDPAAGGVVSGFDVLAGGSILLKRGQRHRPASYSGRSDKHIQERRAGTSADWITLGAYGTGDDPILDGSEVIGGWAAVTSEDVFGNPNWASIEKASVSGVSTFAQAIHVGASTTWPAQWPSPSCPADYQRTYSGNDGHIDIAVANYSSLVTEGATDSGGTGFKQCTITSATGANNLKDRYSADAVDLTGWIASVSVAGARMIECEITDHDVANGVITFNLPNANALQVSNAGVNFRFCIRYHPYDLLHPEQYAWSADQGTAFTWDTAEDRSITRLEYGFRPDKDYWAIENIDFDRFGVLIGSAIADPGGPSGARIATVDGATLRHISNTQNNAAVRFTATGTNSSFQLTNINIEDCQRIGGGQLALTDGDVIDGWKNRGPAGRTTLYLGNKGIKCSNVDGADQDSVHGNGASMYQLAEECELVGFDLTNHTLAFTSQLDSSMLGQARNNLVKNGVLSAMRGVPTSPFPPTTHVMSVGPGEKESTFEGLVVMIGGATLFYSSDPAAEPSTGMTVRNCVLDYLGGSNFDGINFENVLIVGGEDGATGVMSFTGLDVGTTTNVQFGDHPALDGTITETMQQFLTREGAASTYTARTLGPADKPWPVPAWGEPHTLAEFPVTLTTTTVHRGFRANLAFGSWWGLPPGVTVSEPVGVGHNDMFSSDRGQVSFVADADTAGAYDYVLDLTSSHPDLSGSTTRRVTIQVTVV